MATTHIDRPKASQRAASRRQDPSQPEGLRDVVATLGLCVLLIGAGFAAIYVGGDYMAYLLGVDR